MGYMKLGFDVDQVVADCLSEIKEAIYNKFGVKVPSYKIKCYDLTKVEYTNNKNKNEKIKAFILNQVKAPEFYYDMTPIKGSISSLQYLKLRGCEIHFISSRPKALYDTTTTWLRRHSIDFDSVHHSYDKAPIVATLGLDLYVDDVESHLISITDSGYRPLKGLCLYDTPWNNDYNKMLFSKVYEWEDIVNITERSECYAR